MAKKQIFSAGFVPEKFQSIEEMHGLGYALEREREEPVLEQLWIQRAREMEISQSELARRCGLTRQCISYAIRKGARMDILSALLVCDALGIPVEDGFRLGSSSLYVPCRKDNRNLYVNLRTLEVVHGGQRQDSENYEQLYYIQKKGV